MSEEPQDRTFERWALAGACALALVGIAAFLVRREPPEVLGASEDTSADEFSRLGDGDADLVRIRIGGERPPAPLPDPVPHRRRQFDLNPDPGTANQVPPDPGLAAPPAPAPPPHVTTRTVVVQPGETLSQIAQRELGTVKRMPEIIELNNIEDPDDVRAGTTLEIPNQ